MKVRCVEVGNYKVSLTKGKEYQAKEDTHSRWLQIFDDTEDWYLYPARFFEAADAERPV